MLLGPFLKEVQQVQTRMALYVWCYHLNSTWWHPEHQTQEQRSEARAVGRAVHYLTSS